MKNNIRKCRTCEGTGEVENNGPKACPSCGGNGTIECDKKLIIVDGNNRAWAAFHAYEKLSYKGDGVGMIYGLPSMIKALITENEPDELFIVWDGERSKHRIELYPEYKGGRKHKGLVDHDDFLKQLKITRRALGWLGVKQILNPEQEADDMIYKVTIKARQLGYNNIIIISGDKDFNQMISRDVSVYSESKKELVKWINCQNIFGYHSYKTVDYLTLVGDKGDNINGYPGIGEKRAKEFLKEHFSIKRYLETGQQYKNIDNEKLRALYERNKILIDLKGYYERYGDELKIKFYGSPNPQINKEKFLRLSAMLGMKSFMSSGFINKFQWLQRK